MCAFPFPQHKFSGEQAKSEQIMHWKRLSAGLI